MVIESEFAVVEGSPLIGKRLMDIVNHYGVKIEHYHSPVIDTDTELKYNPFAIIKSYFLIDASGSEEAIEKLRLDSVKFQKP